MKMIKKKKTFFSACLSLSATLFVFKFRMLKKKTSHDFVVWAMVKDSFREVLSEN